MPEDVQHTLTFKAPPDDVDAVHEMLETVWADAPQVGMKDRFCFETALIELTANVIRYGDDGAGVVCQVDIRVFADRIEAVVLDSGEEVTVELENREMPDDLAESGRGLAMIQALVDVEYLHEEGRNRWRISRKLNE